MAQTISTVEELFEFRLASTLVALSRDGGGGGVDGCGAAVGESGPLLGGRRHRLLHHDENLLDLSHTLRAPRTEGCRALETGNKCLDWWTVTFPFW